MDVGSRPILRVTITDAISWALIKHKRLNWWSRSGLLLRWSINPSTSLKCMMTDSGKLLSAGLFAHLHSPPACQIYLVWKRLSERSGVSFRLTVDIIMFYNKPNNVWGQIVKNVGELHLNAMKPFSIWSHCQEHSLITHPKYYWEVWF